MATYPFESTETGKRLISDFMKVNHRAPNDIDKGALQAAAEHGELTELLQQVVANIEDLRAHLGAPPFHAGKIDNGK